MSKMSRVDIDDMLTAIANQLEADGNLLAREPLNGSELSQMAYRLQMFAQNLDYVALTKTDEMRIN